MEIGVTCVNPETTDFPSCAQKLSNGTWVSFIWPTLILLPILFVSFGIAFIYRRSGRVPIF